MAISAKNLVELLEEGQPDDIRSSTAVVVGELGLRDAAIQKGLLKALSDKNPGLRIRAIQAIGKLKVESALPDLLDRIKHGGDEADAAAHSAAKLGPKGLRGLQDLLPKVAPGLRRYIASALAASGTAGSQAAAAVLLHHDHGVVEAGAHTILEQIAGMTAAQKKHWVQQLLELLRNKKKPVSQFTESQVVKLLATLDDPSAANVLWERVLPIYSPDVRAAALHAVSRWLQTPSKEQWQRLFACATEGDFRIASPALLILQRLPVQEKAIESWLKLLRAPDVASRKLGLEKLGDRDSAAVAEALLEQTSHADKALRDGAFAALAKTEHGRHALVEALLSADTSDRAWSLARAQVPFASDYPTKLRQKVFHQACEYLDASDKRADPLLFLLRESDPGFLREHLHDRAVALRKKKDYQGALSFLKLMQRDTSLGFPVRLELAACGLKVSGKELAHELRENDPCLYHFGLLAQQDEEELLKEIGKMKWLDPEDLYYLGFHFAEQVGKLQKLGGDVLHLLIQRSPRTKLAQAAKSKLNTSAID
jgi:HEAT repeat protein